MKFQDNTRKRHFVILVTMLVLVVIIVVVCIMLSTKKQEYNQSAGAGDEIYSYSAIYSNRYQLDQLYGKSNAAVILTQIEEMIFSDSALETAPHENQSPDEFKNHYDVILQETSFKKYTKSPIVYTFTITISDGRIYEAYVRQDTERDTETDGKTIRVSTVLKSGENVYFQTNAVNTEMVENLTAWKDRF